MTDTFPFGTDETYSNGGDFLGVFCLTNLRFISWRTREASVYANCVGLRIFGRLLFARMILLHGTFSANERLTTMGFRD